MIQVWWAVVSGQWNSRTAITKLRWLNNLKTRGPIPLEQGDTKKRTEGLGRGVKNKGRLGVAAKTSQSENPAVVPLRQSWQRDCGSP